MTYPRDHLISYVLGELPAAERQAMEAHLLDCPVCRKKVLELQEGLETLVEALPAQKAPDVWAGIEAQTSGHPRKPPIPKPIWTRPAVLAASLLVLGLLGYGTVGFIQHYQATALVRHYVERAVRTETIRTKEGQEIARVIFREDGKALFVPVSKPPADRTYQAWGRVKGTPFSLGLTRGEPLEVQYVGFERVGLSMEPSGGSPKPTHPLGSVELL